jgi:hypothetical protein
VAKRKAKTKPTNEPAGEQCLSQPAKTAHADALTVTRRIDDVLRIRLDGAQFWDLCGFVREKESEEGSAWLLPLGATPLSESQIRRYQAEADALIVSAHERSRKVLFRRHLAQRRHLYAKACLAGDVAAALNCLKDEAKMLGLYPAERPKLGGDDGKPLAAVTFIEVNRDAPDRGSAP